MAQTAKVTLAPEQLALRPGATADVEVTIQNATQVVEHFATSLIGLPGEHLYECEPPVVKLRPKEVGTVRMQIRLPERNGPVAGLYTLGVLVRSPYQQGVSRCEELPLQVEEAPELAMEVQPALVTGRGTARYDMSLRNDGNMPLAVKLTGSDQEREVTFTFQPPELDLPPGAGAYARVTASARRPMTGQEVRRSMSLAAGAGGLTVERPVAFAQKPRIKGGLLRVSGVAAGIAALVGATIGGALLIRDAVGSDNGGTENLGKTAPADPTSQQNGGGQNGKKKDGEKSTAKTDPKPSEPKTDPGKGENPPGAVFADFSVAPASNQSEIIPPDRFADKGISLATVTESAPAGCGGATGLVVRFLAEQFPFAWSLGSALPADAEKCFTLPVRITFASGATFVRVNFTGVKELTYQVVVQLSDGTKKTLEAKVKKDGEEATVAFEPDEGVTVDNVVFGSTDPSNPKSVTAVKGVAHVPAEKP